MNIFKISIAVFFLLIFVSAPAFPVESSPQDSLPIGPSQYKFIIDKIEDGKIMDTATAKTVALEDIIQQTADTQVYIIGEAHDNYKCHTFQRDFVAALHKKHPRLIIGFEFFMRDDNDALELWRQGKITEKELIEKTGWYKRSALNYGYTRLIMDLLKQNKIKPIGLNVPRTILRKVSRQGFDKL
ncbi:MAG: ChaN family lipoprotein, partial [bacterium]|nr:ChaN family lipoprotein [bacterium]